MKRPKLKEGDVVAVPLAANSKHAIGVIARLSGRGLIFCYFSSQTYEEPFDCENLVKSLSPTESAFICQCGDLGIREGKWTVICHLSEWNRERWILPPFANMSDDGKLGSKHYYSDDLRTIKIEGNLPASDLVGLPGDGVYGYVAAEIELNRILT